MAELNQLEQFLRQPDAIMEPNILDVLRRYVSDGGNPATVVEMLSDNYVGASDGVREASMHTAHWGCWYTLASAQRVVASIRHTLPGDSPSAHGWWRHIAANSEGRPAGFAQMASLVVSWTRMLEEVQATAEERPLADFEHDEAHFLRARSAAPRAPRAAAVARPHRAPVDWSAQLVLSTPAAGRPAALLPPHPAGAAGRPPGSGAQRSALLLVRLAARRGAPRARRRSW